MIKIIHAYPDLMNLYGDYANLVVLKKRLANCGAVLSQSAFSVGSFSGLADCDLLYIGAGTERKMLAALADIRRFGGDLVSYCEAGGAALLTGNALALFCKTVTDTTGKKHEGLGLFDADVRVVPGRSYTECILQCELVPEPVVGIVNTSIEVTSRETPLFEVQFDTTKLLGTTEGMKKGNVLATQMGGPLLVRNPALLNHIATNAYRAELTACTQDWYQNLLLGYDHALGVLKAAAK